MSTYDGVAQPGKVKGHAARPQRRVERLFPACGTKLSHQLRHLLVDFIATERGGRGRVNMKESPYAFVTRHADQLGRTA